MDDKSLNVATKAKLLADEIKAREFLQGKGWRDGPTCPHCLGELATVGDDDAWHQERFRGLATEWKKDTFLLSKISAKTLHPAYLKIIGMGPVALPFILRDLRDNGPNHWFTALHAISEESPAPHETIGNIAAMTEAWLQWGSKRGYLKDSPKPTSQPSQT